MPRPALSMRAVMAGMELGANLSDPKGCSHAWQPVSMVFETQLLDADGRVRVRQPDLEHGRVYLVCVGCAQHTYMETSWSGTRLPGSTDRLFDYNPSSSHPYAVDGGPRQRERPDVPPGGVRD